ncbi:MAG TPA: glutaminase A [Rectinemataceae bacterium]|nr:glutaminase A [Rectinemataceae bacterium]
MRELLDTLVAEGRAAAARGRCAQYIPALSRADPRAVGIAVTSADGGLERAGDSSTRFTVQSVSKAMALAYVMGAGGEDKVFSRVGKEPSGDPFNSIIRLETSERGRPFNPMINAGAIVVSGLMPGITGREKVEGLASFVADVLGREDLGIDEEVYASEEATANRNRSIAWFLKELGLIDGQVDETLDAYFRQCALLLDAADLSRFAAMLALDGLTAGSGRRVISERDARIVKSLMLTCGLYDGSGEFCAEAGLPAKSGVGGGIMASARGRLGIGSFGPALDERGNSIAGQLMIARLSKELGLSAL